MNEIELNNAVAVSHLNGMNNMLVILAFVLLAGNVLFSAACGENLVKGLWRTIWQATLLCGMWLCFLLGAML